MLLFAAIPLFNPSLIPRHRLASLRGRLSQRVQSFCDIYFRPGPLVTGNQVAKSGTEAKVCQLSSSTLQPL